MLGGWKVDSMITMTMRRPNLKTVLVKLCFKLSRLQLPKTWKVIFSFDYYAVFLVTMN